MRVQFTVTLVTT